MLKRSCLLVGILLIGLLPQIGGALMVKLDLEDLTGNSDLVIRAEVENIRCAWNEDQTEVISYATLSVKEPIKGLLKQEEIIVKYPGGRIGDIVTWVEDAPNFQEGEDVIVFLDKETEQGLRSVYGNFQGKYTIQKDMVLEKDIPVDRFVSKIKAIVEKLEKDKE